MSRTEQELHKRVDILVKSLEKETQDNANKQKNVNGASKSAISDSEMINDEYQTERNEPEDQDESDSEAKIRVGNDRDDSEAVEDSDRLAGKKRARSSEGEGEDFVEDMDYEELQKSLETVSKKPFAQ